MCHRKNNKNTGRQKKTVSQITLAMKQKRRNHERNEWNRTSVIDRTVERICTPVYQPRDKHWEITFAALGLTRQIIESLWAVFYRINKSKCGELSILEFLNHFNFDRSLYVEKCFEYFDVTGGESIDFLEFVVSVWNICTLKIDTFTNFTFDLYDLHSKGELSLPDIECMVHELYGTNLPDGSTGRVILEDLSKFAEVRGGALNLTSYTIYAANHSLLLLPAFRIQRRIQSKVLGLQYWQNIEKSRAEEKKNTRQVVFDARQAHLLLREFKEGGVDAMLRYWGNPEEALIDLYQKKEQGDETGSGPAKDTKIKRESLKNAVNKVRRMNSDQKAKLKGTVQKAGIKAEKAVDTATSALLDAGIRSRRTLHRMSASVIKSLNPVPVVAQGKHSFPKKVRWSVSRKEVLRERKIHASPKRESVQAHTPGCQERIAPEMPNRFVRRHKERRSRPTTAPASLSETRMSKQKLKAFDHRSTLSKLSRPRTPGSIICSIDQKGDSYQFGSAFS